MILNNIRVDVETIGKTFDNDSAAECWSVVLYGKFVDTNIHHRDAVINLTDISVSLYLKLRKSFSEVPRIHSIEPWDSNEQLRDAFRIDGLDEDYKHCQISLFLPQEELDYFSNIDLQSHQLRFFASHMGNTKDPRPIDPPLTDHLFAYLFSTRIQVISKSGDNHATKTGVTDNLDPNAVGFLKDSERFLQLLETSNRSAEKTRSSLVLVTWLLGILIGVTVLFR